MKINLKKYFVIFLFMIPFFAYSQGEHEPYYFVKYSKDMQIIELGDNLKLLEERFGKPKAIKFPPTNDEGFIIANYGSFSVVADIYYKRILSITLLNESVETYKGLKVGESLLTIKALFSDRKYKIQFYHDEKVVIIEFPYPLKNSPDLQSIACLYDDKERITLITVGATDYN